MNKKTITFGAMVLSLGAGALLITPTVNAFSGGGQEGEMTAERFIEMKQMFASYSSVEAFQEAMQEKREARQVEREAMKEKISHEITKIENGVVIKVTSDDANIVEKIQENQEKKGNREHGAEDITRTVVEIEDGLQITMTTTDSDRLEKMHERADNGWEMKGDRQGGKDGNRKGRRGGRNGNKTE